MDGVLEDPNAEDLNAGDLNAGDLNEGAALCAGNGTRLIESILLG